MDKQDLKEGKKPINTLLSLILGGFSAGSTGYIVGAGIEDILNITTEAFPKISSLITYVVQLANIDYVSNITGDDLSIVTGIVGVIMGLKYNDKIIVNNYSTEDTIQEDSEQQYHQEEK